MLRGIETVDQYTLNIISSAKDLKEAKAANNYLGIVQSSLEHLRGYADGAQYVVMGSEKGLTIASTLGVSIPVFMGIDIGITGVLKFLGKALGTLGVISGSFSLTSEVISLTRKDDLLAYLTDLPETLREASVKPTLEEKSPLMKAWTNLKKMDFYVFKKALPNHLKAKIDAYGGVEIFDYFIEEINAGRPTTAFNVIHEIKTAVRKEKKSLISLELLPP